MSKNILLIQAHPDNNPHLNHALLQAYHEAAQQAGHSVRIINIAELAFSFLLSQQQWQDEAPCADIVAAQESLAWAEHIVLFFPLWMGTMPAGPDGS